MSIFTHAKRINSVARMVILSSLVLGLSLTASEPAFSGKTQRAMECATKGDSKVSKKAVKKVVAAAIKKWNIAHLVDEQKIKVARKEVYEFLKWKLGSPTAICGQYIGAGTKHFIKGYNDEAAAALLGVKLPGDGSVEMKLPASLTKVLQASVEAQGAGAKAYLLAQYGIPPQVSGLIINKLQGAAKKSIGRLGFNMPKSWDIDNRLVEGLIKAEGLPVKAGGSPEADDPEADDKDTGADKDDE